MNNDVIEKLSKFAWVTAIVGVCTLGICPAFGFMALAVPIVFRRKAVELSEPAQKRCKQATILGAAALFLFVADVVLAAVFWK